MDIKISRRSKKNKRFEIKEDQSLGLNAAHVLVDRETGVHYLVLSGAMSGITPLLDAHGAVIVDRKENQSSRSEAACVDERARCNTEAKKS